jgi:hypothetical protein
MVSIVLHALLALAARSYGIDEDLVFYLGFDIGYAIIVTVGTIIVSRLPNNRIGWLVFCSGVIWAVSQFCGGYVDYSRFSEPLPGWIWAAWIEWWSLGPVTLMIVLYWILLFPTGQLLSRRWRVVEWILLTSIAAAFINNSFGDEAISDDGLLSNPSRIPIVTRFFDLTGAILLALIPAILGCIVIVSLVLRFRRSRGVERQQLKWLTYAGSMFAVSTATAGIYAAFGLGGWPGAVAWLASLFLAIVGIPISIGIAILRFRLYDIDVLINRTLVYLTLTVSLLLVYLALVIGLEAVVGQFTAADSSLVVAASTLAVAALFQPLRSLLQTGVDRRFYRNKYDAARTLDAFSARLRDEIDLDTLTSELSRVAHETMQPAHVSLWLRDGGTR